MCNDNRYPFIATLHNVLLALYLYNRLFPIITIMNLVNTCVLHKGFCTVYFGAKSNNAVKWPQSAQRKHTFLGKIKEMPKTKKLLSRKELDLELLHHRLGHIYIRSLLAGYTDNVWEGIYLRIYPEPFCTSCQISLINKKATSKNPIKPKSPFKWVFMDIIPSTAPKSLTSDTTFSNYILTVDAYSKIPKLYGMEKISTKEVMDKLDMFQSIFGKIDESGWWDLGKKSDDSGTQFTSTKFK